MTLLWPKNRGGHGHESKKKQLDWRRREIMFKKSK
jgi:hypothetical protein